MEKMKQNLKTVMYSGKNMAFSPCIYLLFPIEKGKQKKDDYLTLPLFESSRLSS